MIEEILSYLLGLLKSYPRVFQTAFFFVNIVAVAWYFDHLHDRKKRNNIALESLIRDHIDRMFYSMSTSAKDVMKNVSFTCDNVCQINSVASELGAFEGRAEAILGDRFLKSVFRALYDNGFGGLDTVKLLEYKKNKGATLAQNGRRMISAFENQFPHIAKEKECELSTDMVVDMYSEVTDQFIKNKKSEVPLWKVLARAIPIIKKFTVSY